MTAIFKCCFQKERIEYIEEGATGVVCKIVRRGKTIARKKFTNIEILEKELSILKKIKGSERLQQYLYHNIKKKCIYTKYIEGTDLFIHLEDRNYGNEFIQKVGNGILLGLVELEKHGLVHLDIKPENIIIDKNENIHIIDFDTSKYLTNEKNTLLYMCGTKEYSPPEFKEKYYTKTSDVWSVGVILWIMKSGYIPFEDVMVSIKDNFCYEIIKFDNCFINLMHEMLVKDPTKRSTIKQLLEHPFLITTTVI
tara:strand:+ start:253 stop:1008 length:756 start_codon:yes stop_codon:yes gene_type:complete